MRGWSIRNRGEEGVRRVRVLTEVKQRSKIIRGEVEKQTCAKHGTSYFLRLYGTCC